MRTLVIHPKDPTTVFLKEIYLNKGWTVINRNPSNGNLRKQIKAHDRIIMLGHGDRMGLFGFNRRVIDSSLVQVLREKMCFCVWCHANEFVEKYKLKGFYTGMIISEVNEAVDYDIKTSTYWINESNMNFALALRDSIDKECIISSMKKLYKGDSDLVIFNKQNIYQQW